MKSQEFILTYGATSKTLNINPDGWNRNGQSWLRDRNYHGVFQAETVDTFRFARKSGGGGDFILDAYNTDDIKTLITVQVSDLNPQTGGYDVSYTGILNFEIEELRIERDFVEIGFIQSGILQDFFNRDEIDIDIRDIISIDGIEIYDVPTDDVTFKEVSIFSQADLIVTSVGNAQFVNSQFPVQTIIPTAYNELSNEIGDRLTQAGEVIYTNDTTTDVELTVSIYEEISNDVLNSFVYFRTDTPAIFSIVVNGILYVLDESDDIVQNSEVFTYHLSVVSVPVSATRYFIDNTIDYNDTLNIPVGHKLVFRTVVQGLVDVQNSTIIYRQAIAMEFSISEKSLSVGDTTVTGYFPEEVFTKLLRLYTSENDIFYSDFFGKISSLMQVYHVDGTGAFDLTTSGFNLRQYPNRQFVVNFKDYFKSFDAVYNLMCGFDYTNNRFYVEQKSAAYDADNVLFDLGNITSDLIITPFKEAYFNEIMGGYEEKGDYEEFQGATEFNLDATYSDAQPVKRKLNIRSKYNFDSIGMELARRTSYLDFPSTDTKQDDKIFIVRTDGTTTTQGGSDLSGVPGLEERYNICFTPRENAIRWGNFIKSGHWKEGSFTIKYVSGKKSVNITYRNQNGEVVNEFDDISSSELSDLRLFNPQYYEFKGTYSLEREAAIKANPHGLINFTFNGVGYSGFIDHLQSQDYNRTADYKLIAYIPQGNVEMIWDDTTEINAIFEDGEQILFD